MRIINLRGLPPNSPGVVYCGREWAGWPASPLANAGYRDIEGYRDWLIRQIESGNRSVVDAMKALSADSVLGCWCLNRSRHRTTGQRCHTEVIASLWHRYFAPSEPDLFSGVAEHDEQPAVRAP
jgi:hypothetical protein